MLRASAVIVPVDATPPAKRLCRIVEDCGAGLVLVAPDVLYEVTYDLLPTIVHWQPQHQTRVCRVHT